tara:strand:- start:377 stop:517 length:141 start_codon:yes stop_codon:yes gene_type:complete
MKKGEILFKRKSNISCKAVPFKTIIWNYLCWVLAGKPDEWKTKCRG